MPISRRAFIGAGALALLAACADRDTRGIVPRQVPVDGKIPVDTVVERKAGPKSVVMIGDSITNGSKAELTAMFTYLAFTSIDINGQDSRRIAVGNGKKEPLNGIAAAQQTIAANTPDELWVIALGTNDIVARTSDDTYRTLIDEMLAVVPGDRPLVWVNAFRPQYLDGTKQFNAVLADVIGRRGNSAVADWISEAEPRMKELLRSDRLHPNETGRAVFAQVVAQGVAAVV